MRLIKLTSSINELPVYIAPGAVALVRPIDEDSALGTYIHLSGMKFGIEVKEDVATVMNALYYKNDGGHNFADSIKREKNNEPNQTA